MFNRTNFSVHRDVKLDNVTVDETSNISKLLIDGSSAYVPSLPNANNVIPIDTPFTKIDSGYDWSSQPTYTIADPVEGTIKFISLLDSKMVPVKLNTSRGSIIISGSNVTGIIFNEGIWRDLLNGSNPWFVDRQQGSKIVATGYSGPPNQGASVSLSADGNTLAVGGPSDAGGIGAVWIFVKSASTNVWSQQGDKLVGSGYPDFPSQGFSVSLSSDGNTLAIGGPDDASGIGAVWIFVRDASTTYVWSQQGSKLVGTGYADFPNQGYSVSLSADGNTLAVGGVGDAASIGATWVFVRDVSTSTWSQQGVKLRDAAATGAVQGISVSLSADGNTLAVGGSSDATSVGAVWIYIRDTTNVWSRQGSKLVGAGNSGTTGQGRSVSLSADGNTLAVGAYNDSSDTAPVWIFTRSSNVPTGAWTQQGSKLVGTNEFGSIGISVSLSADGNTLAVGCKSDTDNSNTGAVWMFTRKSSTWFLQTKLVGTGGVGAPKQGSSISLSADGNTLAVGGYVDDSDIGATWIFY